MCENWPFYQGLRNNQTTPSLAWNCSSDKQDALNAMALDAYIYGYPLVLLEVTKRIMLANGSQLNQFLNERAFPNPRYTTIVRPNVDTLYSMAWLDLSREPLILSVPNTHHRYYLMEFLDAWSNVFASLGARTTGTEKGTYIVTGPHWNGMLPTGVIRVEAPTNTVWVIGRTQTNGPQDYPAVHAIQDQYALVPLSRWGNFATQSNVRYQNKQLNLNPADQVTAMDAATFFQTMIAVMQKNPPSIEDPTMNRILTILGLVSHNKFDLFNPSPNIVYALESAVDFGPGLISDQAIQNFAKDNSNGWALLVKNIGFYGVDYLQRAMVAMMGIGANLPPDSVYATTFMDANQIPLTGFHNYIIHFNEGQLPPVNAFWSITLYNDKGYLMKNPINRYGISPHLGKLSYNVDGSLTIFVGNTAPGKYNMANWLPAPEDSFNLILRMYWPKQAVLTECWKPPAIICI